MSKKISHEQFVEWLSKQYPNIIISSNNKYQSTHTPIEFTCNNGHTWTAPPQRIRQGHGCPTCSRIITSSKNTISHDTFIKKLKKRNVKYSTKRVYLEENQQYKGTNVKMNWTCDKQHQWSTIPKIILQGHGCPECKRLQHIKTHTNSFLDTHREWLEHQHFTEEKSLTHIAMEIGSTPETISKYLKKHNIPLKRHQRSKGELELVKYLETFNIPFKTNVTDIIMPHELDIYIPSLNMAIEYCGLYWHSDIHDRIDKHYHRQKYIKCRDNGVRLITIFSDEWNDQQDKVKASLRHFLHKSPKGTPGRKVEVALIDWPAAKKFLDTHHLQSAGAPGKYNIGAFSKVTNKLVAVMVIGKRCSENAGDELELTRFVTDKFNNPGIATKMFSWCSKHLELDSIIAFVDLRWFAGACKQEMGFQVVDEIPPSFYWVKGEKRFHRTKFSKKQLLEVSPEFKDLSKSEIMHRLGYTRIWDCGKIKTRKILNQRR